MKDYINDHVKIRSIGKERKRERKEKARARARESVTVGFCLLVDECVCVDVCDNMEGSDVSMGECGCTHVDG